MFKICLLVVATLALGPRPVKGFIGEIEAGHNEFPYHALLKVNLEFFCNGALISSRLILTAGYCINIMKTFEGEPFAIIGADYMQDNTINSPIEGKFNSAGSDDFQFGVNIFLLLDHINDINPVSIPSENQVQYGRTAIVSAIGHAYPGRTPNPYMQKLSVTLLDKHTCATRLNCLIQEYQICAEAPRNSGLVPGDIGGPLVQNGIIFGIAAGTPLYGDRPDIYIDVLYYRRWIRYFILSY